jgi:hypothetical protein
MNPITNQTKFLLRNVNWKNPQSLEGLGYIYFGPLLFNYFVWLKNEIGESDKILFNSREGFFLQEIYELFRERFGLPQSVYFKTSRRLSTIVSLFNTGDVFRTFDLHRYEGNLSTLLRDRFGITSHIENDEFIDTNDKLPNLDLYLKQIIDNSKRVRTEYKKYISEIIGESKNVLMVDSGYQGTTQYNIERTYGLKFKGRYLVYKGNLPLNDVKGFYDFKNGFLAKNIIFFESVFTDKVGSYVDIINGEFINEPSTENQLHFDSKIQIVNGIKKFIIEMLESNVDLSQFDNITSDTIFNLMCTKKYVKNEFLFDTFYHDNLYARNTNKKIIRK